MADDPHDPLVPPIYGARGEEWQMDPDDRRDRTWAIAWKIAALVALVSLTWWLRPDGG